jgi:hypothetical protein
MRVVTTGAWCLISTLVLAAGSLTSVAAQEAEPGSREVTIEQAQAEKSKTLRPYVPGRVEAFMNRAENVIANGVPRWHPFFDNAYSGGGFALGPGYAHHVSPYNYIDVRGSYSIKGYKRAEAEFVAPRLFRRRGHLSVLGGWREATQVGFFGTGMATSKENRTNYDFQRPYGSAMLTVRPARHGLLLRGGVDLSRWSLRPGQGTAPSIETVYTPRSLPGLGTRTTYVHSQGTVGFDWRTSADYARRGGFYSVTVHDFNDRDNEFGFQQVNYEAIQHIPILREAWVISLRALVETAVDKDGQQIPFFLLPSIGGGSTLRGYSSWRFRDRNSMVLQGEWRIMANRFLDAAFFYDTGKVASRTSDLDLKGLKSDYGFGLRFHGPVSTPLRVEVARSPEGLALIFSTGAIF